MSNQAEPQGCLTAILKLFGVNPGRADASSLLPYGLRDDFLSPAELSFCHVLQQVAGAKAVVCPKVNLADLFFVKRPNKNRSARHKIDRKHVDFVLCEPATMKPLCAVEPDDSSHTKPARIERDRFVDQVFDIAGLPLIRVPAARSYSVTEPGELLRPLPGPSGDRAQPLEPPEGAPTCPRCTEQMVLRTASKGKLKGQKF